MIKPEYSKARGAERVSYDVKLSAESAITTQNEVKKPVSLSATAFVVGTENDNGTTKAKIKVAFRFVYLTEDGFDKSDAYADLTAEIPFENALVRAIAEDSRAVSSSDGYVAKCAVKVVADGIRKIEDNALIGGDNLKIRERTENIDERSAATYDNFTITDEFDVGYAIKDVLCHGATVNVKSVQSGVSCIIFEGEVVLSLKTLPFSDGNEILKEKRCIPFRFELENSGSLPDMRASGDCEVEKATFKVYTDEGKGKSAISAEIALSFSGFSVETTTVTFADDVYSVDSEIEIRREELPVCEYVGQFTTEERLSGTASGDIPEGGKIIGTFDERVSIVGVVKTADGVTVNGIARADVAFKNADNGITSVNAESPFSTDIKGEGEIACVRLCLSEFETVIKDGAIWFNYTVKAAYKSFIDKKITVINGVNETAAREKSDAAISVYVPQKGDTLWDISKQLRVDGDEIERLNGELEFPLKGDERIVVYRQKI